MNKPGHPRCVPASLEGKPEIPFPLPDQDLKEGVKPARRILGPGPVPFHGCE